MTSSAFVFPGQGSQSVGMGQALAAASPAAAAVFAAADAALGEPISRLAFEGPADVLDRTENAQPALLATSIAYLAAIRERWAAPRHRARRPPPSPPATRWASTRRSSPPSVISLADGIRLVRERGRLMQASGAGRDGAMAAIIGLDDAPAAGARRAGVRQHGIFGVANRNAPGQVVVSRRASRHRGGRRDRDGARRPQGRSSCPCRVAAHSPLMAEAAEGMRAGARRRRRSATRSSRSSPTPTPAPITTADGARAELVEHLTAGVDWVARRRADGRRRRRRPSSRSGPAAS